MTCQPSAASVRTPLLLFPRHNQQDISDARQPVHRADQRFRYAGKASGNHRRLRQGSRRSGSCLPDCRRRHRSQYSVRQRRDHLRTPAEAFHREPGHLPRLPHGPGQKRPCLQASRVQHRRRACHGPARGKADRV